MAAQKTNTLKKDKGVKTLLSWKAPDRPFKKRSKDYYLTSAAIVFLVVVILLFFKEWFLILAILSLVFVAYTLGTIPPKEVEHKITTQGLISANHSYLWRELSDFWFSQSFGQQVLNINTFLRFPPQLSLVIEGLEEEKIREVLVKYLPFREVVEKTWMDKAAEWLTKMIPLEKG